MSAPPSQQQVVGELYNQHHGWVVQLLRRQLGDRESALDLAQDTFLRLLRSERLPTLREPRAYLNIVASRLCIEHYRRQALEGLAERREPVRSQVLHHLRGAGPFQPGRRTA